MLRTSRVAGATVALAVSVAVVVHAVAYSDSVVNNITYLGVLVGASCGAWIGAERAPRGLRTVPRLVAAGVSLSALGDVVWAVLDLTGSRTDVSLADPPWFASYVFLCVALWVVLSHSRARGDRRVDVDFAIDALTIVVVSVVIFWNSSIDAIIGDRSVPVLVRAVWASYPVMDAVLLALVARVLMSRSARSAIDASFAVGVCLWLAADIAYLQAPGGTAQLALMDAAWMVAPVLLARAAWRAREIHPDVSDPAALGGRLMQLVIAVGALGVPAALEVSNQLRGAENHPYLLLTGTAALIALAFVRTARLLSSEAQARTELEEARDAAQEASRAKTMFLANMSHEIRTPLTTVLAVGELLEDTPLETFQLDLLGKMHRSGEVLKALVERTLDYSRIETGQVVLAPTSFDLHTMVSDVAEVYVRRSTDSDVAFGWHLDAGVPRTMVGDPHRLYEVLTNLLDNALKFTDQGSVDLLVRPAQVAADDGAGSCEAVEFVVADTGIGIPGTAQQSVFESFTQVDGSTTRRHNGSGLGLAICRELTLLMGGSITLESERGVGSTFSIRVPVAGAPGEKTASAALLSSATPQRR